MVSNASSPSLLVLSFALAVVGSWVSLILVEQAIVNRVRRAHIFAMAWMLLSACALGVGSCVCLPLSLCFAGCWAAMLIGVTSISLPDLPDSNNTISFDGVYSFTSILLSLVGFSLAFAPMLQSVLFQHTAELPDDKKLSVHFVPSFFVIASPFNCLFVVQATGEGGVLHMIGAQSVRMTITEQSTDTTSTYVSCSVFCVLC